MRIERLAERARIDGVESLSVAELIAIYASRRQEDADGWLKTALAFIHEHGGIDLVDIGDRNLWREEFGLDEFETIRLQAAVRLGQMIGNHRTAERPSMQSPDGVYQEMSFLLKEEQELFYVLVIDTKSRLKRRILLHKGTLDASLVGAREVFRHAVREAAHSIICVHNHPSGDPSPSIEDIHITERLISVGRELEIPLSDHIIVARSGWTSLRKEGLARF